MRIYDREGYIGRIQWAGWGIALFFVGLLILFDSTELEFDLTAAIFLVPMWIAIAGLIALFSATSLGSDRRRGFLDLLLLTPLEPARIIDGTLFAIWQHLRRTFWMPVVFALLFCFTGALNITGLCCSLATATLYCILLAYCGIACSLTAQSLYGALIPTFFFPLVINVAMVLLIPVLQGATGPAIWALSAALFLGSWFALRRRLTTGAVGLYLLALHLVLVSAMTCWTWNWTPYNYDFPIMAMNAFALVRGSLVRNDWPSCFVRRPWLRDAPEWFLLFPAYWLAVIINIVFVRRWLIEHFDRLAGRTITSSPTSRR
jgi:hypothetical protein